MEGETHNYNVSWIWYTSNILAIVNVPQYLMYFGLRSLISIHAADERSQSVNYCISKQARSKHIIAMCNSSPTLGVTLPILVRQSAEAPSRLLILCTCNTACRFCTAGTHMY